MITPGFVAASSAGDGDPLTQSSGNRAAESAQPGPRILEGGETEMVTRVQTQEQGAGPRSLPRAPPLSPHPVTCAESACAGRDWAQEENGKIEDEMAGWHHRLDGHEFK